MPSSYLETALPNAANFSMRQLMKVKGEGKWSFCSSSNSAEFRVFNFDGGELMFLRPKIGIRNCHFYQIPRLQVALRDRQDNTAIFDGGSLSTVFEYEAKLDTVTISQKCQRESKVWSVNKLRHYCGGYFKLSKLKVAILYSARENVNKVVLVLS